MNFAEDDHRAYLNTSEGRFDVASIIDNPYHNPRQVDEVIYCHKQWVFYGKQKMIRLPLEYISEQSTDTIRQFQTQNDTLALGSRSGGGHILKFDRARFGFLE